MTKIEERFRSLAKKEEKALIPFFTIGYPTMEMSLELIRAAARAGSDIIEAGIPFSDPIADGPTIQFSSQESLKNGTTLAGALESLEKISDDVGVPLVVMSYYNPILAMGLEEFADRAGGVPISGVITPDLPPEESTELERVLKTKGIDSIYLIAPTSSRDRISMVAERSCGFVYAVSVTGVTGSRRNLPPEIISFLADTKKITTKPVCVGFGISTKEQARLLSSQADGIIIGSAIVDLIRANPDDPVEPVSKYLEEMKDVLKG